MKCSELKKRQAEIRYKMLRITVSKSASGAKKYYTEEYYREGVGMNVGNSHGEYYAEKDQIIGNWGGKACAELGLSGNIRKEDFAALCDNQHPLTGQRLTARHDIDRRVGYDFTFNASKSVSLAYAFTDEKGKAEILTAFRSAVGEAMTEIEKGMQTRVRLGGLNENRETANIAYGEFIHFTSRPVDGIADPHLHSHCFVMNITHDAVENKWKAGEFAQIKKDAPYYEALFHHAFAEKLQGLGYEIEKQKTGFELKGVSRELVEKFSRRTGEIEKLAAEKGITDDKRKSELGARTREDKRVALTPEQEKSAWENRLSDSEGESLQGLKKPMAANGNRALGYTVSGKDYVEHSVNHLLERKSVTNDKEVLQLALKDSLGKGISWGAVKKGLAECKELIGVRENHVNYLTTISALQEENSLIAKAHDSKGRFKPLNTEYKPNNERLTDEQRNAIFQALQGTDGITIIAGKAGTGKTTLMKEVQKGIQQGGKDIFAFAPSAEASRGVQRSEGFDNAQTIAALLQSKELQNKLKGNVLWVDEAGMVGVKDMSRILDIAKEQKARLILTGDVKQHNSVLRGDALRILQSEAGIAPVQVSKIQRQKNKEYREAVSFLSKGDVKKGFAKLDKMGAVHEIENTHQRMETVAQDYFDSVYKGNINRKKTNEVLVVSPTHAEADLVTTKIREKLKSEGVIGEYERTYITLKNKQLTEAQKLKHDSYESGNWVVFHQNTNGFKAGGRYEVISPVVNNADNSSNHPAKNTVWVKDVAGTAKILPLGNSRNFRVYELKQVSVAKGDKIRITDNGKTNGGIHLFNGNVYSVEGFERSGDIRLSNGSSISKDFGHFGLGYVMTSHSSQGKTVDKVIISQSSASFRASSTEQFYVSVSRGRESVSIYTDDKKELLQAVSQSNERQSANELMSKAGKDAANKGIVVDLQRKRLMERIKHQAYAAYDTIKNSIKNKVSYELPRKISRTK